MSGAGVIKKARPHWTGATSAFPRGVDSTCCVCVQATHFCEGQDPEGPPCGQACNKTGTPTAHDYCANDEPAIASDPPASEASGLYGMTLVHNGPAQSALFSMDSASGNISLISGGQKAMTATGDLRAVDKKRNIYYYLGDTHAGTTLVGLDLTTGNLSCSSVVPLKEIGFVGIGQSLVYDGTRDELILSGIVANSTGGVQHQLLRSVKSPDADPKDCGSFTKAGTFPYATTDPMLHSTAYDEATQRLFVLISENKTALGLAVIDMAAGELSKVEVEGEPPVDQLSGMTWDILTGRLIGIMPALDSHQINLMSLDPRSGKWGVREMIAPPEWVVGGNLGDVHAYDPSTGKFYAILNDPPSSSGMDGATHIGVIDFTAGVLVSHTVLSFPAIDGGDDPYKMVEQLVWV